MEDSKHTQKNNPKKSRAAWLIATGAALLVIAAVGLTLASLLPRTSEALAEEEGQPTSTILQPTPSATATPMPTRNPGIDYTATPLAQALVERQMLPIPTDTPFPSPTPTATYVPIQWTQAEKNALGWMCYGEVGGMLEVKVDACLSVLSTARVLDFYYNAPGSDIIGVLERAFYVTIRTDTPGPDPDLNWTVEMYANGARGSCSGYMFFNSDPGGPSLCVIRSSNGSWVEFHNGW